VSEVGGLHALRLAGVLPAERVPGAASLVAQGLVADTPAGLLLTDAGHARHAELLGAERAGADLDAMAAAYERFLALNGPVMGAWAEAALFAASRAEHVEQVIRPALARGGDVLCDRYVDSSLAYQGIARGLGVDAVLQLNLAVTGGLLPDVTFLLLIDPGVATGRHVEPDRRPNQHADRHASDAADPDRHADADADQEALPLGAGRERLQQFR